MSRQRPSRDISDLRESWRIALDARGSSPKTATIYTGAVFSFERYLTGHGLPTIAADVTRQHVEGWLVSLRERALSESSVAQYAKSLGIFYRWLADEGEPGVRPDRLPTVKVATPELVPPSVLTDDEITDLIRACGRGTSRFENRRDEAIVRLLADTGIRVGELVGLTLDTIDVPTRIAIVTGKGSGRGPRRRLVAFGAKTANALDRYMADRRQHRLADLPNLWLGRHATQPMSESGVAQMLTERARKAGLRKVNPHLFRHTWAHSVLSSGMNEGDVQALGGWRDRSMLSRYGVSAATERALAASKKLGLGNRW